MIQTQVAIFFTKRRWQSLSMNVRSETAVTLRHYHQIWKQEAKSEQTRGKKVESIRCEIVNARCNEFIECSQWSAQHAKRHFLSRNVRDHIRSFFFGLLCALGMVFATICSQISSFYSVFIFPISTIFSILFLLSNIRCRFAWLDFFRRSHSIHWVEFDPLKINLVCVCLWIFCHRQKRIVSRFACEFLAFFVSFFISWRKIASNAKTEIKSIA